MSFHPLFEGGLCQSCRVSLLPLPPPATSIPIWVPSTLPAPGTSEQLPQGTLPQPSCLGDRCYPREGPPQGTLRSCVLWLRCRLGHQLGPHAAHCMAEIRFAMSPASLWIRIASWSSSTCTMRTAISPTAPCAVRAVSCFCAVTQAAAGEWPSMRDGQEGLGCRVVPTDPAACSQLKTNRK